MNSQKSDQLILKNTPNSPLNKRVCWNARPCYRELECEFCWNRKQPFLVDQFVFYGHHWGLSSFVTISFVGLSYPPDFALQFLAVLRTRIHKKIFKKQKYVSLIAVHGDLKNPHFHIASTEKINKKNFKIIIKKIMSKFDGEIKYFVNVKAITDLYGLGWYFVVHNLRPTLAHRPKGLRLMSASRPFLTGKPKKLKHIQEWKEKCKKKTL